MTAIMPQPLQQWYREFTGERLNNLYAYPVYSTEDAITASTTHTQAGAYQLTAQVNNVSTVVSANDAVGLPVANVGKSIFVTNSGVSAMRVYGSASSTSDTINGIAGATGISQPVGTTYQYNCTTAGAWVQASQSESAANQTVTSKLTYTGPRVGTFTLNGATNVSVANTLVTANSMVVVTLNTVGGTVGTVPAVQLLTPATGFTVKGQASDTSIYNYALIENQ